MEVIVVNGMPVKEAMHGAGLVAGCREEVRMIVRRVLEGSCGREDGMVEFVAVIIGMVWRWIKMASHGGKFCPGATQTGKLVFAVMCN